MFSKHKAWLIPTVLMLLLAPFTPWIDLAVTGVFYTPDPLGIDRFSSGAFVEFMFNYGIYPAWIVTVLAGVMPLFSKKWRSPSLVWILTFAIGVGFITHLVLKDHWGRPRPKQVTEFGGPQEFRPFYSPNFFHQPEPSKSFPCGHCGMGFVFFAAALVGRRLGNKLIEWAGWIIAFGLGTLLSITRIMQGGHFTSDVLMSALILWLTALFVDWLIYEDAT